MKKILAIMQLPPPVHGQSIMNQIIHQSELINNKFDLTVIPLHFAKLDNLGKADIHKFIKMIYYAYVLIKNFFCSKPDLVYFTLSPVGFAFYRDCLYVTLIKIFKVPIVYHLHGKGIKEKTKNKFIKFIYSFVFKNSSVILLSTLLRSDLEGVVGRSTKIFYLPNGIAEAIPFQTVDHHQTSSEKAPILLFLSNIVKTKGVFVLLEAVEYLIKKKIRFKLKLVGGIEPSISKKKLYKKIEPLNDFVEYLGPKYGNEKSEIFASADIFVFPTYNEAFPLVLLEAMQAGLPVISTYEGAIPEIVGDGETGFLVKQNEVGDLADKIEILLKDDILRKKMGQEGKKKFFKNYTIEIFEKNLKNIFDGILK